MGKTRTFTTLAEAEKAANIVVMRLARGDQKKIIANEEKFSLDFVMKTAQREADRIREEKEKLSKQQKPVTAEKKDEPYRLEMSSPLFSMYVDHLNGKSPAELSKTYHMQKKDVMDILKKCKGSTEINEQVESLYEAKAETEEKFSETLKKYDEEFVLKLIDDYDKGYNVDQICKRNKTNTTRLYEILYSFYGGKEKFKEHSRRPGRINDSGEKEFRASWTVESRKSPTNKTPVVEPAPVVETTATEVKLVTPKVEPKAEVTTMKKQKFFNIGYGNVDLGEDLHDAIIDNEVTCELVADRHNTGQELSIFEDIEDENILNFGELELKAEQFLSKHVKPGNKLTVYVTGLQSALAAIINVCNRKKVDLDLMHWDPTYHEYRRQFVYREDRTITGAIGDDPFFRIKNMARATYVFGKYKSFCESTGTLYAIRVNRHDGTGIVKGETWTILFDSMEKVWPIYGKLVQHLAEISTMEKFFISVTSLKRQPSGTYFYTDDPALAKSYNFNS